MISADNWCVVNGLRKTGLHFKALRNNGSLTGRDVIRMQGRFEPSSRVARSMPVAVPSSLMSESTSAMSGKSAVSALASSTLAASITE